MVFGDFQGDFRRNRELSSHFTEGVWGVKLLREFDFGGNPMRERKFVFSSLGWMDPVMCKC